MLKQKAWLTRWRVLVTEDIVLQDNEVASCSADSMESPRTPKSKAHWGGMLFLGFMSDSVCSVSIILVYRSFCWLTCPLLFHLLGIHYEAPNLVFIILIPLKKQVLRLNYLLQATQSCANWNAMQISSDSKMQPMRPAVPTSYPVSGSAPSHLQFPLSFWLLLLHTSFYSLSLCSLTPTLRSSKVSHAEE